MRHAQLGWASVLSLGPHPGRAVDHGWKHFWSGAVATGGNRWQVEGPRKAAETGSHFQPGTRPACSIHFCISGPCVSSRVATLT
jgi:hypothetical protein